MKTYRVKESWIFNLESMDDKLNCLIYDIDDDKVECPFNLLGTIINDSDDIYPLIDEINDLCWIAKSRKVTSAEYGRIKSIVEWRVNVRYNRCLASGMNEHDAGMCFEEM